MARPSDLPKWNETEERVLAPNTTQEQTGFVWSGTKFEKPKGELFNYLLNNTYKWIKHFDEDGVNTKLFDIASGTANAITLTIPSITSYEENTVFMFKAIADNTGATTVNVNSLGAIAVVINNVALTTGQIESGKEYFLRYSSNSNFELVAVGGGELDIDGLTAKTTPVDADTLVLNDSADSNTLKKLSWANLKATLLTYFDTLYSRTSAIFGIGQTWQDLTASRSAGVTYTNTTGKPITIAIISYSTLTNAQTILSVDGQEVSSIQAPTGLDRTNVTLVNAGSTYNFTSDKTLASIIWKELR